MEKEVEETCVVGPGLAVVIQDEWIRVNEENLRLTTQQLLLIPALAPPPFVPLPQPLVQLHIMVKIQTRLGFQPDLRLESSLFIAQSPLSLEETQCSFSIFSPLIFTLCHPIDS